MIKRGCFEPEKTPVTVSESQRNGIGLAECDEPFCTEKSYILLGPHGHFWLGDAGWTREINYWRGQDRTMCPKHAEKKIPTYEIRMWDLTSEQAVVLWNLAHTWDSFYSGPTITELVDDIKPYNA